MDKLIDLIYEKILDDEKEMKDSTINNLLLKNKELITSINYKKYKNLDYDEDIIKLLKNIIVLIKIKKINLNQLNEKFDH